MRPSIRLRRSENIVRAGARGGRRLAGRASALRGNVVAMNEAK